MFIDLEKAYNKVPKELLKWMLIRKIIPMTYINVVEDMCEGTYTSVKSVYEEMEGFKVKVSVPQELALSSYLFSVVKDEVTKRYRRWYHGVCYLHTI